MTPFDRTQANSDSFSIVTLAISRIVSETARYWPKIAIFPYPILLAHSENGNATPTYNQFLMRSNLLLLLLNSYGPCEQLRSVTTLLHSSLSAVSHTTSGNGRPHDIIHPPSWWSSPMSVPTHHTQHDCFYQFLVWHAITHD